MSSATRNTNDTKCNCTIIEAYAFRFREILVVTFGEVPEVIYSLKGSNSLNICSITTKIVKPI